MRHKNATEIDIDAKNAPPHWASQDKSYFSVDKQRAISTDIVGAADNQEQQAMIFSPKGHNPLPIEVKMAAQSQALILGGAQSLP